MSGLCSQMGDGAILWVSAPGAGRGWSGLVIPSWVEACVL